MISKSSIDKLKEGSKKTLLGILTAYGMAALMKELTRTIKGDENPQKRLVRNLEVLLSLWAIFRIKMDTGNERGRLHEETNYEDFGGLKHYVYAGFSQLTYLNWFNAKEDFEGLSLEDILTDENRFKILRSDSYNGEKGYYLPGRDYKYMMKINNEEPFKIYDGEDKRIYFLYSENMKEPHLKPKFPELQEWKFVYGFDHKKILDTMRGNMAKRALLGEKVKVKAKLDYENSDFQAAVFKHEATKKVMIAYRGTDPSHLADWLATNFELGTFRIPDALTCAVWVYEKVATDPKLKDYEIHVTGHSMGGALSQYIAVYGYRPVKPTVYEEFEDIEKKTLRELPLTRPVHKTVTFNGLGIGKQYKAIINNHKKEHYKVYANNFFAFMNAENKVLNFYMQNDGVSDIQIGVGKSVMVDTVEMPKKFRSSQINILGNDMAGYHSVSAFLPFIHNGNIVRNKFTRNHLMNAIKQTILIEKKEPMKALFGSTKGNGDKANTFMENIRKSAESFQDKQVINTNDVEKSVGYISVMPEESYYLEEEFGIPYIDCETSIEHIYDSMTNKKEANGNIFYHLTPYNYDKDRTDWYVYKENEKVAEIGSFNNVVSIVGVEGGPPLRIKLPEKPASIPKELEKRQENFYVNRLASDSVEGFSFMSYSKFILTQEIGKHNAFVLEGRISQDEYQRLTKLKFHEKEIAITPYNTKENNIDIEKSLLIRGIIKKIELRKNSPRDYFLKINGVSKSYLIDKQKRNKAFFNKSKSYKNLFSEILSDNAYIDFYNNVSQEKLGKGFIQYKESDWEFLKRVCSNLGTSCIVDKCTTKKSNENKTKDNSKDNTDDGSENKQNIYLGYYDSNSAENVEKISFFDDKILSKNSDGVIVVNLDKILRLGSYIKKDFLPVTKEEEKSQGDKEEKKETEKLNPEFMIKRIEARLERDVINYYYTLVPNNEETKIIKPYFNKKIGGRTLQAVVRRIKQITNTTEEVKDNRGIISLDLDLVNIDDFENSKMNNDNLEESYLYPINSSYSGKLTGEFISPNVGNHVMIYFPNNNEDEGQVIPGIRKNTNNKLHKPQDKVIGIDSGQGLILNKEKGISILGNSFDNPDNSKSIINVKPQGVELYSEKDNIGMALTADLIKIITKNSGIEFTDDSILIKSGGTIFEVSKKSIDGLEGTLKITDSGVNTKDMIIV